MASLGWCHVLARLYQARISTRPSLVEWQCGAAGGWLRARAGQGRGWLLDCLDPAGPAPARTKSLLFVSGGAGPRQQPASSTDPANKGNCAERPRGGSSAAPGTKRRKQLCWVQTKNRAAFSAYRWRWLRQFVYTPGQGRPAACWWRW